MREIEIKKEDAGQRLDKLLAKYLPLAEKSFIHKMLRKKNITLNDKKAGGEQRIKEGDRIRLWLAEETIEKFAAPAAKNSPESREREEKSKKEIREKDSSRVFFSLEKERIVYEDEELLVYNKPAGLLSQKAQPSTLSLNDLLLQYLGEERNPLFKPSICNRLDRNTSGLVICAKTYRAARCMGDLIKERKIEKYYLCAVSGIPKREMRVASWLKKEEKSNKSLIKDEEFAGAKYIETKYRLLYEEDRISLLLAKLITGRSHQIRAQLSYLGYPILGDKKYAKKREGEEKIPLSSIKHQLLHAYLLKLPSFSGELSYLSGMVFCAPPPRDFFVLFPGADEIKKGNKEGNKEG
ncbi:MAG: RluA family pseudouridine synthase [Johnsonella sp.]|nr:RluA family pseudouridine synthase [Johnsonella sp.]